MIGKRAYLVKERKFEIVEENIVPQKGQVLVKVEVCGLCNWELNFWKGTGDYYTNYPQVIGHEWAGTVVELGEGVTNYKVGDKVTVLPGDTFEGFAEYVAVNENECYKLSADAIFENSMGEPLKCISTVISAATPRIGDYGVVLGCGAMGLWCVQALCGNLLAGLIAIDIDDKKLELAKKFGATHTINSKTENAVERVMEITNGRMADFLIEGTGLESLLSSSADYLKLQGRLVVMSSYEDICKEFDFRTIFYRGIDVKCAHPTHSDSPLNDMTRAVALINNNVFRNEEIITHRFKLEEINEAFEILENKPKGYIKGVVVMN
ncbi:MAG: zinc-binding dehydrogenase [Clostridia bacterium]|nr:zinc-binding dehydrogenase [Clostridia bacterium]